MGIKYFVETVQYELYVTILSSGLSRFERIYVTARRIRSMLKVFRWSLSRTSLKNNIWDGKDFKLLIFEVQQKLCSENLVGTVGNP